MQRGISGFNYFQGEELWEADGKKFYRFFKIQCPECKAEGKELVHHNWFESKEMGTPLLIKCKNCGAFIDADNECELDKAKVEIGYWEHLFAGEEVRKDE